LCEKPAISMGVGSEYVLLLNRATESRFSVRPAQLHRCEPFSDPTVHQAGSLIAVQGRGRRITRANSSSSSR
jgi:hypothetical protein